MIVRCVLSALTSRGGGGRGSLELKQMLFGFRVWGLGFRVQDLGFRVQGVGLKVGSGK